jgi:hypothetical protein
MAAFTTLAIASLIGTGVSAYGQWRAGGAAAKAGRLERAAKESEAELADYNAAVADLQAEDALARGAEEENNFRAQVKTLIGRTRTSFAAGNIDVTSGLPVDVAADIAHTGELDALTIRNNAAREAWGFNVEGEDLRRRATIIRKEGSALEAGGRAARSASRLSAASTLATGGASILFQKYGFDRAGRG